VARVPTGEYPAGLGYDRDLRRIYSGDTAAGTVTVIDVDTLRPVGTVHAELEDAVSSLLSTDPRR
jgi:DNA-binding beta-propeller fold protein YncE